MHAGRLKQDVHYPNFPEFDRFGIDLSLVDADLILALQEFREDVGIPMIPNPNPAGWGREYGPESSRHYAIDRLADAGDFFPTRGRVLECWAYALTWRDFGGIGVYVDTELWGEDRVMIHVDLRLDRPKVIWGRDAGEYFLLGTPGFAKIVERITRR